MTFHVVVSNESSNSFDKIFSPIDVVRSVKVLRMNLPIFPTILQINPT